MCAGGCGFFGSTATDNFCSVCYKKQQQASSVDAGASSSVAFSIVHDEIIDATAADDAIIMCANGCGFFGSAATDNFCSCKKKQQETIVDAFTANLGSIVISTSDAPKGEKQQSEKAAAAAPKSWCEACRKKLGLLGFVRCGSTYCGVHRYADKHECDFDYKTAGRQQIAVQNPVIVHAKLDKI